MKAAYLVHNLNDPAVERRCTMLTRGGAEVRLAGFCRDEKLSEAIGARTPMELGVSADAAMAKRAIATLRAVTLNASIRHYFEDCDVVIARNIEQLAIARAIVGPRPLIYECLDIHRLLVGRDMVSRLVQSVEARLLPRVDLLITSSPAFVEHHFAKSRLCCPIALVENKLLVDDVSNFPAVRQPPPAGPMRIGWFGMLRCRRTLDTLIGLAKASRGAIEILIAGKPSPAIFPDFSADLAGAAGVEYIGPYHYTDLPALYGRCHFAWTIDWYEEGANSDWLLPNRIYEAVAHGSVPIALAGNEVGRWLASRRIGLLVTTADELNRVLGAMTADEVARLQAQIHRVPRSFVLADDGDCRALVSQLYVRDR